MRKLHGLKRGSLLSNVVSGTGPWSGSIRNCGTVGNRLVGIVTVTLDRWRKDEVVFQHQSSRALLWFEKKKDAERYECVSYWEAWFGGNYIGFVMEYDHAAYPYFLDHRFGAFGAGNDYTAVEAAKAVLQYTFDRPQELADYQMKMNRELANTIR